MVVVVVVNTFVVVVVVAQMTHEELYRYKNLHSQHQ